LVLPELELVAVLSADVPVTIVSPAATPLWISARSEVTSPTVTVRVSAVPELVITRTV
jgi:hypothetical protein